MKRLTLVIVFLAIASFGAAGQAEFSREVRKLPSARRTEATLKAVLPMYFGASALLDPSAPGLENPGFTFGIEMMGVRVASKGGPLEANVALGWEFLQHAAYLDAPVRLAVKPSRKWKIFAGASPAVLVGNPVVNAGSDAALSLNRYHLSAQAGAAYRTVGLYASYGLTPFYASGSDAHTLSFGLVIGI